MILACIHIEESHDLGMHWFADLSREAVLRMHEQSSHPQTSVSLVWAGLLGVVFPPGVAAGRPRATVLTLPSQDHRETCGCREGSH